MRAMYTDTVTNRKKKKQAGRKSSSSSPVETINSNARLASPISETPQEKREREKGENEEQSQTPYTTA